MWNICRVACPTSASDKISEYSRNILWNKQSNTNIKQFDDKKIMVVDTQPYKSVISRVVSADTNTTEQVVGRKKIIPDIDLVKSLDSNDLVFDSRTNSEERVPPQTTDQRMENNSVPETEYRQSYTWNRAMTQVPHKEEQISLSEYRSSFAWPKASAKEVSRIEPIIEPRIPGKAVQLESSAKKSATISNFAEVIGKPDVIYSKESQPVEVRMRKTEYNANFEPFSAYVFVSGNGFKKPKDLDRMTDEVDKAKSWYSEVEERSRQANHYKTRSQLGHPLNSEGLTKIYSQESSWNNYHVDRNLQALALATTQMIIKEKKEERNVRAMTSTPKSSRLLSSAPPSLRSEAHIASRPASTSSKSPNPTYRPRSVEKHPKTVTNPKSDSEKATKPEGKIWLKPKKLTQEPNDTNSGTKPSHKSPIASKEVNKPGNGGPKSPRPTSLTANDNSKNNSGHVSIPPLPSGPVRTTQVKSPEEITGVKSPSPESWTVPIDKGLNWMNGETPTNFGAKHNSNSGAIKPTPVNEKFYSITKPNTQEKKPIPEEKNKKSKTPVASHPKPTAKVQPSHSSSSGSTPASKYVQSIDEEVKVVKPVSARQKASNVLDKARNRLDQFWSRNK